MKNFSKYYIIQAPPSEVYRAITNSIALSMWTEEEATMSEEVNSEFSLWGGNISGKNLEFEKNRNIMQLPSDNFLLLKKGGHAFFHQELLLIASILKFLKSKI